MRKDINDLVDETELDGTFCDLDCLTHSHEIRREAAWRHKLTYPDYQHGEVKIYTREEIDEYQRSL